MEKKSKTRAKKSNKNTRQAVGAPRNFAYPDEPLLFPLSSAQEKTNAQIEVLTFPAPAAQDADGARVGGMRAGAADSGASSGAASPKKELDVFYAVPTPGGANRGRISAAYTTPSKDAFTLKEAPEEELRALRGKKKTKQRGQAAGGRRSEADRRQRAADQKQRGADGRRRRDGDRQAATDNRQRAPQITITRRDKTKDPSSPQAVRTAQAPQYMTGVLPDVTTSGREYAQTGRVAAGAQTSANAQRRQTAPVPSQTARVAAGAQTTRQMPQMQRTRSKGVTHKSTAADRSRVKRVQEEADLTPKRRVSTQTRPIHDEFYRTPQKKKKKKTNNGDWHDDVYSYIDGKRRLDVEDAAARPSLSNEPPRERVSVVRPEGAKNKSKPQETNGEVIQPKGDETLTDLQTAIPVRSGKGNTRPAAMREERETRRKKEERLTYMIVACVILFIVAGVMLARIYINYRRTADEYAELQDAYVIMPFQTRAANDSDVDPDNADFYPALQINFASLYALNNDFIGWLYVPGCGISYPIVQGKDNDHYLTHTYLDTVSSGGAIFLDYGDRADFTDFNTFIYGHNMQDGSMFGTLRQYRQDMYLADRYPYFYVYLSSGAVHKYRICSFYTDDGDSDSYLRILSDEDKQPYVNMIMQKSVMELHGSAEETAMDVTGESYFATLSTCDGRADSGMRFLVHGYLAGVFNE